MNNLVWFISLMLMSVSAVAGNTNGYLEKVMLLPDNIVLDAKLDSGAATSSLNVKHVKIFKKNTQQWVAFDIYAKQKLLKHDAYPLLKMISIKNRASENTGSYQEDKRPLIAMRICLGQQVKTVAVNLMDRQNFNYPFLFGRQAMRQFNILMNPSKKYLNPLKCSVNK
jgi:hypothetical protein